jgi:hypothetical protein
LWVAAERALCTARGAVVGTYFAFSANSSQKIFSRLACQSFSVHRPLSSWVSFLANLMELANLMGGLIAGNQTQTATICEVWHIAEIQAAAVPTCVLIVVTPMQST